MLWFILFLVGQNGSEPAIGEYKKTVVAKRNGAPVIGGCVSVGINATVVGAVHVGNDVMTAPNSFVNFDVPDHSVVIGNPGVIHHKENAAAGYIGSAV